MRRIAQNPTRRRSRAPVFALWFGAAVALAATGSRTATAEPTAGEETAFVLPRLGLPDSTPELSLPTPLSPADAALIRRALADQDRGKTAQAQRERQGVTTHLLDGPILAKLYLGRHHRSTVTELKAWLRAYGDQPDAAGIRELLRQRLPRRETMPPGAPPPMLATVAPADKPTDEAVSDAPPVPLDPQLRAAVAGLLRDHHYRSALRLLTPHDHDELASVSVLRAEIARELFVNNWDSEAEQVAAQGWAATPAKARTGEDAFNAGLASWRLGRIDAAATWFARAAEARQASAAMQAAGAFWAARAARRLGDDDAAASWLRKAGTERRTFYGLVARRMLGWGTGLILGRDLLSQADMDALEERARGRRAFALIQVGETARAENELRALWPEVKDDPPLRRALLLVAASARMTDLAAQLAALVQDADGVPHDALWFPVPRLRPLDGFKLDPALVYGITRTESNFRAEAVSPAGARGLMQIMPATAHDIAKLRQVTPALLGDPGANLWLGQKVLLDLAHRDAVAGDLIRLLAAYNAGPGSVASWDGSVRAERDPFLYVEAIPITETRNFVKRVLAGTWIYAARLGLPAPSLDAMAEGRRPRTAPVLAAPDRATRAAFETASSIALP